MMKVLYLALVLCYVKAQTTPRAEIPQERERPSVRGKFKCGNSKEFKPVWSAQATLDALCENNLELVIFNDAEENINVNITFSVADQCFTRVGDGAREIGQSLVNQEIASSRNRTYDAWNSYRTGAEDLPCGYACVKANVSSDGFGTVISLPVKVECESSDVPSDLSLKSMYRQDSRLPLNWGDSLSDALPNNFVLIANNSGAPLKRRSRDLPHSVVVVLRQPKASKDYSSMEDDFGEKDFDEMMEGMDDRMMDFDESSWLGERFKEFLNAIEEEERVEKERTDGRDGPRCMHKNFMADDMFLIGGDITLDRAFDTGQHVNVNLSTVKVMTDEGVVCGDAALIFLIDPLAMLNDSNRCNNMFSINVTVNCPDNMRRPIDKCMVKSATLTGGHSVELQQGDGMDRKLKRFESNGYQDVDNKDIRTQIEEKRMEYLSSKYQRMADKNPEVCRIVEQMEARREREVFNIREEDLPSIEISDLPPRETNTPLTPNVERLKQMIQNVSRAQNEGKEVDIFKLTCAMSIFRDRIWMLSDRDAFDIIQMWREVMPTDIGMETLLGDSDDGENLENMFDNSEDLLGNLRDLIEGSEDVLGGVDKSGDGQFSKQTRKRRSLRQGEENLDDAESMESMLVRACAAREERNLTTRYLIKEFMNNVPEYKKMMFQAVEKVVAKNENRSEEEMQFKLLGMRFKNSSDTCPSERGRTSLSSQKLAFQITEIIESTIEIMQSSNSDLGPIPRTTCGERKLEQFLLNGGGKLINRDFAKYPKQTTENDRFTDYREFLRIFGEEMRENSTADGDVLMNRTVSKLNESKKMEPGRCDQIDQDAQYKPDNIIKVFWKVEDGKVYKGMRNILDNSFGSEREPRLVWWKPVAVCTCDQCNDRDMRELSWDDGRDGGYSSHPDESGGSTPLSQGGSPPPGGSTPHQQGGTPPPGGTTPNQAGSSSARPPPPKL